MKIFCYHQSVLLIIIFFIINCAQNNKVDQGEEILGYLLTQSFTPVKIAGRAMSSGVIKNAKVEVRTPGEFSKCSSTDGTLLGSGTTNSRGGYSVSIKRQGCPVCVVITPGASSQMYDPKQKKDIPWTGDVSLSGIMKEPAPGKKVKRKNISPQTRVASRRANARSRHTAAQTAIKLGIKNYDFSYHEKINKSVTVNVNGISTTCNTSPTAIDTANQEVAQVYFLGDDSIDDIMELDIDFDDESEDAKKYDLQLKAFSQLAKTTADDFSGADADDYEQIFDAIEEDFSDGDFDGQGYSADGLTTSEIPDIETSSGGLDVEDNFLSTTFHSAMSDYVSSDPDHEFTNSDVSDNTFCDDYSATACSDTVDGTDINDPDSDTTDSIREMEYSISKITSFIWTKFSDFARDLIGGIVNIIA